MKKTLSIVLALVLILSTAAIFGVSAEDNATVRVIVRNTTFPTENGAPWDGILLDTNVVLSDDDTMESVIKKAVTQSGFEYSVTTAYGSSYISSINGLEEYAASGNGGWMASLNDWFTADSTSVYTVANGGLSAGDEIIMMYTCAWGGDVGSLYGDFTTTLTALSVNGATVEEPIAFDPNEKEYTLAVNSRNAEISVLTEAYNKNYQTRTYLNDYQPEDNDADIRRGRPFTVDHGDVVYVGVGNPAWPSMNSWAGTADETVYQLNVEYHPVRNDADGNGMFDISDVTTVQRHLAEFFTFDDIQMPVADADGNGRVSIYDATQMQRILAEFIE